MPDPSAISVLQVVTTDRRRGAETFAVQLGEALAPLVGRVGTVALAPGEGAPLGVPTLGRSRRDVAGVRRLRRLARDADVVVAHGSASLWGAVAATTGTAVPFVYRLIGEPTAWTTRPDRRLRVALALRRAAAVCAYYPAAADALVRHLHLRPAAVHVIPKGIDPLAHPPAAADEQRAARSALGVAAGGTTGPVLAWVGALAPEKRPWLALEVAERLPGATLLVAGDGPLHAELAARSGPAVRLLGPQPDVRPVLAAADVVLLTSRTEGVPGVALEAAALARPVVAVDVGGVDRVVVDGVTGALVAGRAAGARADEDDRGDGDDLVERLAAAVTAVHPRGAALGAAARRRVEDELAMDEVARRWADLLGRVARRP